MSDNHIILKDAKQKRMLIYAIVVSNLVTMFNAGAVNIAMPIFMNLFHTTLNHVQWVTVGYILSLSCVMPLVSALCERYSYRGIFLKSLIGVGITSVLCALSTSLPMLIAFRVLSGFCAGIITSSSMAIIYRYIPAGERAKELGSVLALQSVGFAVGPAIGGMVIEALGWRFIFILPALFIALAYWRATRALPCEPPTDGVTLHLAGVSMVSLATTLLLLAFTYMENWGVLSLRFLGMMLAAVALLTIFIIHNRNNPHPSLDFSLFRDRHFTMSTLLNFMISLVTGITASILAIYVQSVRGYSPLTSGVVQFAPALVMAAANMVVTKIYRPANAGIIMVAGFALAAIGNGILLFVNMHTTILLLSLLLCVRYAGVGSIRLPVSDVGMAAVPDNRVSHASALINWINQISRAISTNVLTVVFTWRTNLAYHAAGYQGTAMASHPGFGDAALVGFHLVFSVLAVLMIIAMFMAMTLISRPSGHIHFKHHFLSYFHHHHTA